MPDNPSRLARLTSLAGADSHPLPLAGRLQLPSHSQFLRKIRHLVNVMVNDEMPVLNQDCATEVSSLVGWTDGRKWSVGVRRKTGRLSLARHSHG